MLTVHTLRRLRGLDIPRSAGVVGVIGQIGHSHGNLNQPLERMGVGGMNPQVTVFFGPRDRDTGYLSGCTELNLTVSP